MPAKYRRIAVVEDPELAEALDRAADRVPHRSRASLLRELALDGARKVAGQDEPTTRERLLAIPGATGPADGTSGIPELLKKYPLGEIDQDDPYGLSRALEEQREERL